MKYFTPKRLALPLALTGAVLPLVLIGCGGGSSNPTPNPTSTPTGTATATPTSKPTATPTPSNECKNEPANLTFSAFNGYNGSKINTTCGTGFTIRLAGTRNSASSVISLFEDTGPKGLAERRLTVLIVTPGPITNGTRYNLASPPANSQIEVSYLERANGSNSFKKWNATSGTLTINEATGTNFALLLGPSKFTPESGGAAGSFTLNGPVAFNDQRR